MLTSKSRFVNEIPEDLLSSSSPKVRLFHDKKIYQTKKESPSDKIKKGSLIEHKMFGKGEIVNIEGAGDNSKITILFTNNITKKFILKYANLKIIK